MGSFAGRSAKFQVGISITRKGKELVAKYSYLLLLFKSHLELSRGKGDKAMQNYATHPRNCAKCGEPMKRKDGRYFDKELMCKPCIKVIQEKGNNVANDFHAFLGFYK